MNMLGWSDQVAIIFGGEGGGLLQKECCKDCSSFTEVSDEKRVGVGVGGVREGVGENEERRIKNEEMEISE